MFPTKEDIELYNLSMKLIDNIVEDKPKIYMEKINRDLVERCCCCKKDFIWKPHRAYGEYHESITSEGYEYPLITCEECYKNKSAQECAKQCESD